MWNPACRGLLIGMHLSIHTHPMDPFHSRVKKALKLLRFLSSATVSAQEPLHLSDPSTQLHNPLTGTHSQILPQLLLGNGGGDLKRSEHKCLQQH